MPTVTADAIGDEVARGLEGRGKKQVDKALYLYPMPDTRDAADRKDLDRLAGPINPPLQLDRSWPITTAS